MGPLTELIKLKCEEVGIFKPGSTKKLLQNVFVPLFLHEYLLALAFNISQQSCELATPIVLRYFIQWHGSRDPSFLLGAAYAAAIFVMAVVSSWSMAQSGVKNYVSGMKSQGTMMALIFEKSTRLTGTGTQTIGQIVNYMSADARRFPECGMMTNHVLMTPIWLALALLQLVWLLGVSGLIGTAIMVLGLASNRKLCAQDVLCYCRTCLHPERWAVLTTERAVQGAY